MWKDTEYFKNKGGECHTQRDKSGECSETEALVDILMLLFLFFSLFSDLHRWAVFLLLQLGEQIQDTEMVLVDRTLTDISFQNNVLL